MNKISKKPYIIEIKKFKNNEKIINNDNYFLNQKEFSPLSGSELKYNPSLYNNDYNIKNSHNCYTYALGKFKAGDKTSVTVLRGPKEDKEFVKKLIEDSVKKINQ